MASHPLPAGHGGHWNGPGQQLQNLGGDGLSVQTRLVSLKVHYTFDKEGQTRCLARPPHHLDVSPLKLDDRNTIAVVDLNTCLQAVMACSPELTSHADVDYAVYAYDCSEQGEPLMGQGLLSTLLDAARIGFDASPLVAGRIIPDARAVLTRSGPPESIDVCLKLSAVPRRQVADFQGGGGMDFAMTARALDFVSALTPSGAAEWNSFLHTGQPMAATSNSTAASRVQSPILNSRPDHQTPVTPVPQQDPIRSSEPIAQQPPPLRRQGSAGPKRAPRAPARRHSLGAQQSTNPVQEPVISSPQAPQRQSDQVPHSGTPPTQSLHSHGEEPQGQLPPQNESQTAVNLGSSAAGAASNPASRSNSKKRRQKPPTGRPRGRPRKRPAGEGNTSGYEEGTDGDEGPVRKKKRVGVTATTADVSAASPFTNDPESLRIAASTSASIRNFRPVGARSDGASGGRLRDVPRAPTPVPQGRQGSASLSRSVGISSLRRQQPNLSSQANFSDGGMGMSPGPYEEPSPMPTTVPTPNYPDDSSAEIGSSPPIRRTTPLVQSSPPPSSPQLPPRHEPHHDSGFMSGSMEDIENEITKGLNEPALFPDAPAGLPAGPSAEVPLSPSPRPPLPCPPPRTNTSGKPRRTRGKSSPGVQVFLIQGSKAEDMVRVREGYNGRPKSMRNMTPDLPPLTPVPIAPMPVEPPTAKNRRSSASSPQPALAMAPVSQPGEQSGEQPSEHPGEQLSQQSDQQPDSWPPYQDIASQQLVQGAEPMPQQGQQPGEQPEQPNQQPVAWPLHQNTADPIPASQSMSAKDAPKRVSKPTSRSKAFEMNQASTNVPTTPAINSPQIALSLPMADCPHPPHPQNQSVPQPADSQTAPLPPVPDSDPAVPSAQLALPDMTLSEAPCPSSPPQLLKSNKNLVKKMAIKQKLMQAIQSGEMPAYCTNCGNIETPTWRKIWVQDRTGVPDWYDYSEKPGQVTTIMVKERGEDGQPTSYRVVKKTLGLDENRQEWTELLLCNPCGIWLSKFKSHRPKERWEKDYERIGQERRKRGTGPAALRRKARTQGEPQLTSDAGFATDAQGYTEAPSSPGLPDNSEKPMMGASMQISLALMTEESLLGRPQSAPVSLSPVPSDPRSSHSSDSQGAGTAHSPIAIEEEEEFSNTRRLLFPSPRKDGEAKVLGEVAINLAQPVNGVRSAKAATAEKENDSSWMEAERDGLSSADYDAIDALFESPPRPSTPPPRKERLADVLKTPTRVAPPTPSHRPITRSISRTMRPGDSEPDGISPEQVALLQKTPSRAPRLHRATGAAVLPQDPVTPSAMLRRSPRILGRSSAPASTPSTGHARGLADWDDKFVMTSWGGCPKGLLATSGTKVESDAEQLPLPDLEGHIIDENDEVFSMHHDGLDGCLTEEQLMDHFDMLDDGGGGGDFDFGELVAGSPGCGDGESGAEGGETARNAGGNNAFSGLGAVFSTDMATMPSSPPNRREEVVFDYEGANDLLAEWQAKHKP